MHSREVDCKSVRTAGACPAASVSSLARVMAAKAAAIGLLLEGGMAGGIVFGSRGISDDVLELWEVWSVCGGVAAGGRRAGDRNGLSCL